MLTIVVGPLKENIISVDGARFKTYPLIIEEDGKLRSMHAKTDFADVTEVEMFAVRRYLPFRAFTIHLTDGLKKAIAEFLCNFHAKQNMSFDCYSFACMVSGIKEPPKKEQDKDTFRKAWKRCRRRLLRRPGDVIFLVGGRNAHFKHAAIYIGLGLWLSVYGAGGDLEIATLRDMKKGYEAHTALNVTPR